MELFQSFLDSLRKDKKKKAEVERRHNNPSFLRLKKRFIENSRDMSSGMASDSITFGELCDACYLYCDLAEGGNESRDMAKRVLKDIAESQKLSDSLLDLKDFVEGIFSAKTLENEESLPLYVSKVDLAKIIEDEMDDLTHYPGGFMLSKKLRGELYQFLITNRQFASKGKLEIEKAFVEVGLPVLSNITE